MKFAMIAPPAAEPVTLAEAKEWLRVDGVEEDAMIARLIVAAREAVERLAGPLVTQSWRATMDRWPPCEGAALRVALGVSPLQEVSAVRVRDAAGAPQTIDAAMYRLVGAPDQAEIVFSGAPAAPGRAVAGIEIDCVVGHGAPVSVPATLRQAVLECVARWFERRGDAPDQSAIPHVVRDLVAPWRRARLV